VISTEEGAQVLEPVPRRGDAWADASFASDGGPQHYLRAAASALTIDVLSSPPAPAHVLEVFPSAVYLAVPSSRLKVLPLLTADALLLPTGMRLSVWSEQHQWRMSACTTGLVGDGEVRFGSTVIRAVRTWHPQAVRPTPPLRTAQPLQWVRAWAAAHARSRPHLSVRASRVTAAVLRGERTVASAAVATLLGRGPGPTPAGDDALRGVLLGLGAQGCEAAQQARALLWSVTRHQLDCTTDISAALLSAASLGHAVPQVVGLVQAVTRGDVATAARHLPRVLAIGQSAGIDLLAGFAGALCVTLAAPHRSTDLVTST
jgi:hypothetical protein